MSLPQSLVPRWRPKLRVESVVLIVMVYMVATANGPWWTAVSGDRSLADPATWLFLAACFSTLVALHFTLVAAFVNRWIVKPALTLILVATAAAAHFMRTYAVLLDPTMLRNVVHTDLHEAGELLSWTLVGDVATWATAPVAFVWLVSIDRRPWLRSLAFRAACVAVSLVIAAASIMSVSRDLTSLMRDRHELRYLITPGNYLFGLGASALRGLRAVSGPRLVIGADARLAPAAAARAAPKVLVLVLGETARAANFSLLGYARITNPELAGLDLIAFRDVTSCGTSTEVSVPCMFSRYGRSNYDERLIRRSEGLLDVLARGGYSVRWRDNQSGCKGVCNGPGIDYRKLDATLAPDLCVSGQCLDEILVRSLDAELATVRGNTVIVLHMMGNHGPAYYRRYPEAYRRFRPDCQTAQLRNCDHEQLVNAYDNAILYTDHVLAELVEALRTHPAGAESALLYVSDHGESLGESRLYLHGIPYAIAPDVQTHVPMLAWVSDGLTSAEGLERQCLERAAGQSLSHDNLFDTVLGLLQVETSIYRPEGDFMRPCRANPA